LVVDGKGGEAGQRVFATLEQALSRAASGDVIELRFNGPLDVKPATLSNLRLTLRSGEAFQPVLVFRPATADPTLYPRAMFALNNSDLRVIRAGLELEIPAELQADHWSLFEIQESKSLRLEGCVVTVRNASPQRGAYQQDVAVFRIQPPAASDVPKPRVGETAPPPVPLPPIGLELNDCVVRGEAMVVKVHGLRPIALTWDNGLLATTERLLVADGGDRTPAAVDAYQIALRHVTLNMQGGMCRLYQSESAPRQLLARIDCVNSILTTSARPLIEQLGVPATESDDQFRGRIEWTGERNFYQGIGQFWKVQLSDPDIPMDVPEPVYAWDIEAWKTHWGSRENLPQVDRVQWARLPGRERPMYTHAPKDYALDAAAPSPSPGGAASDRRDAGALADRLPQVP
jgi:hypothetical protein